MNDRPLISIVTPSYNQAEYLEETIQSVLGQDYPAVEYIVIDGGSSDGSPDIIRRYEEKLAYWVSEPDRGQVDALEKGFAIARGEILGWLNSDDIYLKNSVIAEVAHLCQQFPTVDVVTGGGVIISGDGHWQRRTQFLPNYISYDFLRYRNMILQPATFFKREVWTSHNFRSDLHYAFDWDYWIRLARDFNILPVDSVWAGYRMWGENKTASGSSARTREQADVLGQYLGRSSWQYLALNFFAASYRLAEKLPEPIHPMLKRTTRLMSRGISALTRGRFPIV